MQIVTTQINFSGLYRPPGALISCSDQNNSLTIAHTQSNILACLFLLAVSLPADHPIDRMGVFIRPNSTHTHTLRIYVCIQEQLASALIDCLGNTKLSCVYIFRVSTGYPLALKYFPMRSGANRLKSKTLCGQRKERETWLVVESGRSVSHIPQVVEI